MSFSASDSLSGQRGTYRRSGRVNWLRLAPFALLALAVSLGMAFCLFLAFRAGWYYYLVVPAVASAPVAVAARVAVGAGHCRNRAVAATLGLLAALVLYLGYFHIHLVAIVGPAAITRVDALPWFIAFRMQTDEIVDEDGQGANQSEVMNWTFFGAELVMLIAIVTIAASTRSNRVYCEHCGRWARRLLVQLPSGSAAAVGAALKSGRLGHLPEVPRPNKVLTAPCASFTVEYCRKPLGHAPCPVYLTASELIGRKGAQSVLGQAEVTPEELAAIAEKMPALGPAEAGVRCAAAQAATATAEPAGGPAAPFASSFVAAEPPSRFVESLPKEWGDQVLSTRNRIRAAAASFIPVVSAAAGLTMIGVGLWRQPWAVPAGAEVPLVDWLLLGGGALAAAFGVYVCWQNVDFFNFRFGQRVTRRAIQARASAIVNPDDPDAVYVDVVPRKRWANVLSDSPSDVGFVKVDLASRTLLFEGVRQRYRIPGDALASCEVEPINAMAGRFTTYVTVIRAQAAADSFGDAGSPGAGPPKWEAPLLPRPTRLGKYGPIQRRGLPEQLQARIRAIMRPSGQPTG